MTCSCSAVGSFVQHDLRLFWIEFKCSICTDCIVRVTNWDYIIIRTRVYRKAASRWGYILISAPKYSVTLLTPDTHQAKTHPRMLVEDSQLPLVQWPKILGVYPYTSLSFIKHSDQQKQYIQGLGRYILETTEGNDWWGTRRLEGRSATIYAAHVWSPNLRDTNYRNIRYAQNEALRITSEDCHWLIYPVSITCTQKLKCWQ